jgi:malonyl CoA-acyl carrier protein transacylase
MTEHLTQNNGVVCHHCFKTIDLTKINWKSNSKWFKRLEKLFGPRTFFTVSCPHCKQRSTYTYDKDVKPISDWEQKEPVYQKQIEQLIIKILETKVDNVQMAKELAIQELNEIINAVPQETQTKLPKLSKKEPYD